MVNGVRVHSSSSVRFLGINFHSSLKWHDQVQRISAACVNPMKIISCLRHTWWGADPSLLIRIYNALIRSRIEYGCFFLHNLPKSLAIRLDRIQFKALRLAMGYRNSTPTNVILAESKSPPLPLRSTYLANNYIIRALTRVDHPLIRLLDEMIDRDAHPECHPSRHQSMLIDSYKKLVNRAHLINSDPRPLSCCTTYNALLLCPVVDTSSGEALRDHSVSVTNSLFQDLFKEDLLNLFPFYTDGSKSPNARFTGFAFATVDGDIRRLFRAASFVSSFCLEAFAIIECLNFMETFDFSSFTIFSDARTVLLALEMNFKPTKSSYLILQIRERINSLREIGKAVKVWIPGHCGVRGNEIADSLAKEAVRTGRDTQLRIPVNEFRNIWKEQLFEDFNSWAVASSAIKGAFFFGNFHNKSKRTWFESGKFNRKTIVVTNRLRSGHSSLRSNLYRFKIVDTPFCTICGVMETSDHVFWSCSRYEKKFRNIL